MTTATSLPALDKRADLAGPGIGTYEEVAKILPNDYTSLLDRKETQKAIAAVKRYIEDGLCRELNLIRVEVPLIVDRRERRQRQPRPRRLAHAGRVPVRPRHRPAPRRPGGAGGHQVEADGAQAVRLRGRRGHQHRHARGAQGLLPRPRPQRLRRPVGLGAGDHRRRAQPRLPRRTSVKTIWKVHQGRRGARAARSSRSSTTDEVPASSPRS